MIEHRQHITHLVNQVSLETDGPSQFAERDERIIWQRFIEGDDQSLIYLYRNYVQMLFRYGQQFSTRRELVQDCIQELFYELIDKRQRLSPARSIKGYLFASLKRKISRAIKKEERHALHAEAFNFSPADVPHSINLREQDCAIIHQKINSLPTSQREVIFLYFYQGLSYSEIAEVMRVKVATARTLTYRALESLEKNLRPVLNLFSILLGAALAFQ